MAERIPRDFIHQLLNRTDIVELIDNRLPLKKKSGNNYFACCPFHDEKSASFSVSHTKQFYHCFGCGAHGNAIDFLMQYDRLSFPEAVESLATQAGLVIPKEAHHSPRTTVEPDRYLLLEKASQFYRDALRDAPEAIDYLKQRGLSGEMAKAFGIGYAPAGWSTLTDALGTTPALRTQLQETGMLIRREDGQCHDRFRQRIMFPIHDRRGRIVGFGGRILGQGEPKYLNSPETPLFHKGRELYGLHHVLKAHRDVPRLLVVEGYMDVIALFQHGVACAVATLGTATTASHLETLFRHTSELIFCFDGDAAGRTAAQRALQVALPQMQDGRQIRFLFLPEGDDPDTLIRRIGPDAFQQHMAGAMSLSQFFFQSLAAQADLSSLDGRARFSALAMTQLDLVPDGIFKTMMREELAKRARTHVAALTTPQHTTARRPTASRHTSPTTPLRLVLSLLLQQPTLAALITPPLPPLNQPGFSLLNDLLNQIEAHRPQNAGELRECWRDHPEATLLEKLACLPHSIPIEGIESEFQGALLKLRKRSREQVIQQLLARASSTGLTDEEKTTLSHLIHHKETTE